MIQTLILFALLSFGAIAQQITNPNSGAWAGDSGQQVFSPFPLGRGVQWPDLNGAKPDVPQETYEYMELGILACAAEIGNLKNSVFKIQTQMTTFQTSLDTLSGNISALSQNQRTTGPGGAVAVPGLDKVLAVSATDVNHGIIVKSIQTTDGVSVGGNARVYGQLTVDHEFNAGIAHVSALLSDNRIVSGNGLTAGGTISGVSEPTTGTDAATKNYVDMSIASVGNNTVTLYTVVPSGSGIRLQPVRISGVKSESTAGLESYELQPKSVLVSASGSGGKLTTSSETIWTIAPSTNRTESVVIEFVDHGTLN